MSPLIGRMPVSRRAVGRVLVTGIGAAALIWTLGFILGRARLGTSDADTMALVEREVSARFEAHSAELRGLAGGLAAPPSRLVAAAANQTAARELFDAAANALQARDESNLALTVYDAGSQPLAWAGRASEVPDERIAGPQALFVAPGPLGPRLVYVAASVTGST